MCFPNHQSRFDAPAPSLGAARSLDRAEGRVEDGRARSPPPAGPGEARECGARWSSPLFGGATLLFGRAGGRGGERCVGGGQQRTPPGRGDRPAGGPVDRRRVQLASRVRGASVMGYKREEKYFSLLSTFALPGSLLVRR